MDIVSRNLLVIQAYLSTLPEIKLRTDDQKERILKIYARISELRTHSWYKNREFKSFRKKFRKVRKKYDSLSDDKLLTRLRSLIPKINSVKKAYIKETTQGVKAPEASEKPPSKHLSRNDIAFITVHQNTLSLFRIIINDIRIGVYGNKIKDAFYSLDNVFIETLPTLALVRVTHDDILNGDDCLHLPFYSGSVETFKKLSQDIRSLNINSKDFYSILGDYLCFQSDKSFEEYSKDNPDARIILDVIVTKSALWKELHFLSHSHHNVKSEFKALYPQICKMALTASIPSEGTFYHALKNNNYYTVLEQSQLGIVEKSVINELKYMPLSTCELIYKKMVSFGLFEQAKILYEHLKNNFSKEVVLKIDLRCVYLAIASKQMTNLIFTADTLDKELLTAHRISPLYKSKIYFAAFYHHHPYLTTRFLNPKDPLYIHNTPKVMESCLEGIVVGNHHGLFEIILEQSTAKPMCLLTTLRLCCKHRNLDLFNYCLETFLSLSDQHKLDKFHFLHYQELIRIATEHNIPQFLEHIFSKRYSTILTHMSQTELQQRILTSYTLALKKGYAAIIKFFLNEAFTGKIICGLGLYNDLQILKKKEIPYYSNSVMNPLIVINYLITNNMFSMLDTLNQLKILKISEHLIQASLGYNDLFRLGNEFIAIEICLEELWSEQLISAYISHSSPQATFFIYKHLEEHQSERNYPFNWKEIFVLAVRGGNVPLIKSMFDNNVILYNMKLLNLLCGLTLKLIVTDQLEQAKILLGLLSGKKYILKDNVLEDLYEKALDQAHIYGDDFLLNQLLSLRL